MSTNVAAWVWRVFLVVPLALAVACEDADNSMPTDDAAMEGMDGVDTADAAMNEGSTDDAAQPQDKSTVSISDGMLMGKADGDAYAFLGIPYAEPPLGELRFELPKKNAPWEGVRDATEYGKRCAQLESTTLQNAGSEDEDCLYLNVWTADPTAAEKKPVMVWIHGGGNVNGSASEPVPFAGTGNLYSGKDLAENGDVVVVTFNYRLGVFGFLSHADLGAHNQGLRDQTMVLEWVRDNIEAFGGDPEAVTIYGESAGSFDVCLHVASPLSRGLFHRAISQSGGCATKMTTADLAHPVGEGLVTALGCDSAADAISCLRDKPVADLLGFSPTTVASGAAFGPVVDTEFMPTQPGSLYMSGDIADVPYMLGSNTDEGTLFSLSQMIPDEAAYLAVLASVYADKADQVAARYPYSDFADAMPSPGVAAFARALGDSRLVCSTYYTAVLAKQAGRQVYMYNFDIPVVFPGASAYLGAAHGAELVYVFGTSTAFTEEKLAVSDLMQRYWTNFAKTGDPNGGSDMEWPLLGEQPNKRMNFSLEPMVVENFRTELCEFWQSAVYEVL